MKRRDFLLLGAALPASNAFAVYWDGELLQGDGSEVQQKSSLISLLARNINPALAQQVHGALRQDPEAAMGCFLRYEFTWEHALAFAFDRSPMMLPVLAGDVNEAYLYGRMLSPANLMAIRANIANRINQAERLGAPRYGAAFSGSGNFERITRSKGVTSLFQMWLINASAKFADNLFSDLAGRVSGVSFDSIEDAAKTIAQQIGRLNSGRLNQLFAENFLLPAGNLSYYGFQKADPNTLLINGFSAGNQTENATLQFDNGWSLTTNQTAFSPSKGIIGGAERFVTISSGEKRSRSRKGFQYGK